MTGKLFISALVKYFSGVILLWLLLFPIGGRDWTDAYIFMGVLFVPMFIAGLVMMVKDPGLLKERLDMKERESEQKTVILISGILFLLVFVLAALNHRYGWLHFPVLVRRAAAVIFLLAYAGYAEVLRENRWLSRTVKVQEGQEVVNTGLYGIVRHPMYAVTVWLFLSMPVMLDSPLSFVIMLGYIPVIVKRILNEEKVLRRELKGYEEYTQKVKYRLLPMVW